jgi:uncharacterized membrane protein YkgB
MQGNFVHWCGMNRQTHRYYGTHHAFLSNHYARSLGSRPWGCKPRLPYLSGVGRLIVKDSIMLGAAVLTMADAARESLPKRTVEA